MRKTLLLMSLPLAFAACKSGPAARPTAQRDFTSSDVANCYNNARRIDPTLGAGGGPASEERPTEIQLFMYVDKDGSVPVAFIHDAKNLPGSRGLVSCLLESAISTRFEPEDVDYLRPEPIQIAGTKAVKRQLKDQPPGPLNQDLARSTLTIAEWATPADRGWGFYYVGDYAKAQEAFRQALQAKPDDVKALRGLAETLAASRGDLKEARQLAERAVKAEPNSEATHEALLRVCLAQKDDKCAFEEFEAARKAPEKQVKARSFELALIQDEVKAAAERLNKQEGQQAQEQAVKAADPTGCGKFPEGDERTICFVKYCFGAGAQAYAKELKPITGQDYSAGEWKVANKGARSDVTVQIRARKVKGAQPHDATWSVKAGDNIDMRAANLDASQISQKHNACQK